MDLHMLNLDQMILVKDHRRRHSHPDDHDHEQFGKRAPPDEEEDDDDDRVATSSDHEEKADSTPSLPSSVGECADSPAEEEDDDDGFRTPTAPENKILAATEQCPPAPRKPQPSAKRKSPVERTAACRSLIFDFSEREFEAMFPPVDAESNPDRFFLMLKKKPRRDSEDKEDRSIPHT